MAAVRDVRVRRHGHCLQSIIAKHLSKKPRTSSLQAPHREGHPSDRVASAGGCSPNRGKVGAMLLQTHRALVFQLPTLFRRSRALTATLSPQAVWRTSPCQLQVVRRVRCLPVNCVWCGVDGASGAEARIRLGMTSGSGSAVSLTRRPSSSSRDCVCVRLSVRVQALQ